jgi:hypothetical protein
MASLRDLVFTPEELQQQVTIAFAQADYCRSRNRQDAADIFDRLGTALRQALTPQEPIHARSTPEEKGPDPSAPEPGNPPQRKRVRRLDRPGSV